MIEGLRQWLNPWVHQALSAGEMERACGLGWSCVSVSVAQNERIGSLRKVTTSTPFLLFTRRVWVMRRVGLASEVSREPSGSCRSVLHRSIAQPPPLSGCASTAHHSPHTICRSFQHLLISLSLITPTPSTRTSPITGRQQPCLSPRLKRWPTLHSGMVSHTTRLTSSVHSPPYSTILPLLFLSLALV